MTVNPAATLADAADRRDWVRPAILMLLGTTIFWAPIYYRMALAYSHLFGTMPVDVGGPRSGAGGPQADFLRQFFGGIMGVSMGLQLLEVIRIVASSWFLRCGLFYLVGRGIMKGREKSFWSLFTTVGWAWWPLFLQMTIAGIAMAVVPSLWKQIVALPEDWKSATSPAASLRAGFASEALLILNFATPFVWWNWGLCALAVRSSLQLDRMRSILVVAAQVLFHALGSGLMYFGSLMLQQLFRSLPGAGN